jgi:amino acid transporter
MTYPKGYDPKKQKQKQTVRERVSGGITLAIGLILLLGIGVGYTTFLVVSDSKELKTYPSPFVPGETLSYWEEQTAFDAISNMSRLIITGAILTIVGMIILHSRGVVNGVGLAFIITAVTLGFTTVIFWIYLVSTDKSTEQAFYLGIVSIIWLFVGYVIKLASDRGKEEKERKDKSGVTMGLG